ncbi:MAG: LytTR family DNA-binding domain-containing protein [Lachnospiraceae bacterium]|nr:LytTR family DNA-binding domain-containing protein [Lachnospiraceae bacterium]MDD3796806.1 LytTR family DNA-binding domain-containing protein [Lachnospiraceae bacterium]
MIKIAIVEDEDSYIRQLTEYLQEYQKTAGEEIDITVFHDGDGITAKYKPQYDIILMDIQMKFVDGMTAAEEIRKVDSKVIIIFITNMTQYAINGYKVDALDYILKPVSYFAFCERLGRAIARLKRRSSNFVTISVKGGIMRLDTSDIYYVESQGHNLVYHTSSGDHLASGTMRSAEEQLSSFGFSRGNKSYLINLAHVDGIQDKCAQVKGEHLLLSRPRQNAFMQDLTKYWGEL